MNNPTTGWRMPHEGDLHRRTWMAFAVDEAIWGPELLPEVRRNLVTIARTIAGVEPVSMLVREQDTLWTRQLPDSIQRIVVPLDDLWLRDTGPVFVVAEDGQVKAVDFNFNGWGSKQTFRHDGLIAGFVADQANASRIDTRIVLEGGCIEVDGAGTAIITESSVLNPNRNPGLDKARFEKMLMPLIGLKKIIWLPGIRGKDITDGHTDFYVRFVKPGVVLTSYDPDPQSFDHEVTITHRRILQTATDAQGRRLEVIVLEGPATIRGAYANNNFAAGYIGFYLCNGAVLMQEFGDQRADRAARQLLQMAFSDRTVFALNVDGIAAGGGSIHCTTQQEPFGF